MSSPSQALRGAGPRVSRVSAASVGDELQRGRKESYAKNSRPALGTHSKLLRALSGATSGQVPYSHATQLLYPVIAPACVQCEMNLGVHDCLIDSKAAQGLGARVTVLI